MIFIGVQCQLRYVYQAQADNQWLHEKYWQVK